jgi:hypothetical protein
MQEFTLSTQFVPSQAQLTKNKLTTEVVTLSIALSFNKKKNPVRSLHKVMPETFNRFRNHKSRT